MNSDPLEIDESNDADDIIVDYMKESDDKVVIQSMSKPNANDAIYASCILKNYLKKLNPNPLGQF